MTQVLHAMARASEPHNTSSMALIMEGLAHEDVAAVFSPLTPPSSSPSGLFHHLFLVNADQLLRFDFCSPFKEEEESLCIKDYHHLILEINVPFNSLKQPWNNYDDKEEVEVLGTSGGGGNEDKEEEDQGTVAAAGMNLKESEKEEEERYDPVQAAAKVLGPTGAASSPLQQQRREERMLPSSARASLQFSDDDMEVD